MKIKIVSCLQCPFLYYSHFARIAHCEHPAKTSAVAFDLDEHYSYHELKEQRHKSCPMRTGLITTD